MKIVDFRVENYRGVRFAEVNNAGSAIVLAGPNGCGKSCILDAIRLFKSAYGSYHQDELDLYFNEFQLGSSGRKRDFRGVIRNQRHQLRIIGNIEISEREKKYLLGEGKWMIKELIWKEKYPNIPTFQGEVTAVVGGTLRDQIKDVEATTQERMQELTSVLNSGRLYGELNIHSIHGATITNNVALRILFQFFEPDHMGIIDYHGSHRSYSREQLRSINLKEADEEDKVKSAALYNYEAKYATLKRAMASEYVKELLEREASGLRTSKRRPLKETLEELFQMFLPGKNFKGPVPQTGGELGFPVNLSDGSQHDLNELSSGEKEILFAYLRARTLAPRQSVLLIDEPELHLNPGLVQGLPRFYENYIGKELENQIWLVTHSDRFLREALDTEGMSVYHMQHAIAGTHGNQLKKLDRGSNLEAILIDLVGDLASYRPEGKTVLLEGESSRFDEKMIRRLFPELASRVNFISAGPKKNVKKLQDLVSTMKEKGQIQGDVWSIIDPDDELWNREPMKSGRIREWDAYHIENYLLVPDFILKALQTIDLECGGLNSERDVEQRLETAAEMIIPDLASNRISNNIWRDFRKDFPNLQAKITGSQVLDIGGLKEDIKNSGRRIQELVRLWSTTNQLEEELQRERTNLQQSWQRGDWRKKFPGRKILQTFCGELGMNIDADDLRIAIVGEMAKEGYKPQEMQRIFENMGL